jgi:hypothetical protein
LTKHFVFVRTMMITKNPVIHIPKAWLAPGQKYPEFINRSAPQSKPTLKKRTTHVSREIALVQNMPRIKCLGFFNSGDENATEKIAMAKGALAALQAILSPN